MNTVQLTGAIGLALSAAGILWLIIPKAGYALASFSYYLSTLIMIIIAFLGMLMSDKISGIILRT